MNGEADALGVVLISILECFSLSMCGICSVSIFSMAALVIKITHRFLIHFFPLMLLLYLAGSSPVRVALGTIGRWCNGNTGASKTPRCGFESRPSRVLRRGNA